MCQKSMLDYLKPPNLGQFSKIRPKNDRQTESKRSNFVKIDDYANFFDDDDDVIEIAENSAEISDLSKIKALKPMDLIVKSTSKRSDEFIVLATNLTKTFEVNLILRGIWYDSVITVSDRIRIFVSGSNTNKDFPCLNPDRIVFDNSTENFLLICPDKLMTATEVASGVFCRRRAVLNDKFKTDDVGTNKALILGTLLHQVFQESINNDVITVNSFRDKFLRLLYKADLMEEMYFADIDTDQLISEADVYFKQFAELLPTKFKKGSKFCENSPIEFHKVRAIEENVWSAKYGIRGKIDLTISVKHKVDGCMQILPVELKTGKTSNSAEHKAQVMMYNLMLSEIYSNLADYGTLLYMKDGKMFNVDFNFRDLRGIFHLRNELARCTEKFGGGKNAANGTDFLDFPLPEPIYSQKFCPDCPQLLNCALMHKLEKSVKNAGSMTSSSTNHWISCENLTSKNLNSTQLNGLVKSTKNPESMMTSSSNNNWISWENLTCETLQYLSGIESNEFDKSIIIDSKSMTSSSSTDGISSSPNNNSRIPWENLTRSTLQHLTDAEFAYFRHWLNLICLHNEQDVLKHTKNLSEIWNVPASEREAKRQAICDLKLSKIEDRSSNSKLPSEKTGFYRLHLTRRRRNGTFANNNDEPLLPIGVFHSGEYVILSNETRNHLAQATGFVDHADHSVLKLNISQMIDIKSTDILRLDKYRSSSTTNLRNYLGILTKLLRDSNISNKIRRLIIDRNEPIFLNNLPVPLVETIRPMLTRLNRRQLLYSIKVLRAQDYVLINDNSGNGYTEFIVNLIEMFHLLNEPVLIAGFTNSAVDNILKSLQKSIFNDSILRIGSLSSIDPDCRKFCLKNRLRSENRTIAEIYEKSTIFVATCSTVSTHPIFTRRQFYAAIILATANAEGSATSVPPEKSATAQKIRPEHQEPLCIAPMLCAQKFILIGRGDSADVDKIRSRENERTVESLFTRLARTHPDSVLYL